MGRHNPNIAYRKKPSPTAPLMFGVLAAPAPLAVAVALAEAIVVVYTLVFAATVVPGIVDATLVVAA